ncbi:DNA-directed RNA polymerase II subunit RPB1-like isoform X3 [Daphnia carinata]|uniref:DNA-directed RNA polymerase II subunit RPB1-like isoform X3 n=1 Tax=Daphnia carinata TaxID=120202 RepID=UPI00257F345D|nr:DNA-directed RNA polymerase II subunit RPB1-like isoform X3 [Daphnia carinata]
MSNFSIVLILWLSAACGADSFAIRSKRAEESSSNATTRQLGGYGFPAPYSPPYGGYNSHQQYPSYGGHQPTFSALGPYPGGPSPLYQQQGYGVGSYPGASPYGQYPSNGIYGGSPQSSYYPSTPTHSPYPTNSFNPSYGTYPPNNGYGNYNPSIQGGSYNPPIQGGSYKPPIQGGSYNQPIQGGSYNPTISAITAQSPYRPSSVIPDPFGSVAPVIGNPPYSPVSSGGSSYNPSAGSSFNPSPVAATQTPYKPITIIESPSYNPSYQGSSSYKPSSSVGSQEGYDSVVVNAQGYDQPSSYKPSSGSYKPPVYSSTYNKPQSSNYQPSSSYSGQNSYRPITVQASIQEIPNSATNYPSSSQNRPSFYSASSDKVTFPKD